PMATMNPTRPEPDSVEAQLGDANHQDLVGQNADAQDPDQPKADKPPRQASRSAPMKFMYASGDRPLDGYTIKRGVGRGGFGEVYFAESDAGKEVAMKLIRRNLDVELRGVRHCLNLKHPNLIALYDIRSDDSGDEWVIMEYVSGSGTHANSLEDALQRHPDGMPEEEVLRWMHGIAAGVSHLHDNGIVHRDLKPGNIFVDGTMVKIGDYGLSKFISCSRRSGQTESVGTVHYMAPEIANGRYGREIDTYALGIILYEMLTGHVPFEGESVGEVLMKHLTAEPDLEKISQPYKEIVRRALTKDPESRIRSVAELEAMLPGAGPPNQGSGVGGQASVGTYRPVAAGLGDGEVSLDTNAPISADARRAKVPPATDDEPIFRSMADGWAHFWERWHASDLHPVAKAFIILGTFTAAVFLSGVWLPALMAMTVFYLIYYVIWVAFIRPSIRTHSVNYEPQHLSDSQRATQALPIRKHRHMNAAERRRRRLNWREQARKQLAEKPLRTKLTELLGSMLVAAALCAGGSVMATLVIGGVSNGADSSLTFLWFAIVSTLGTWAVLATNKFTEGVVEDQVPMRGLLLALGAVVGIAAGLLSAELGVGLPRNSDLGPPPNDTVMHEMLRFPGGMQHNSQGLPLVGVAPSVAYFAALFVLLRWWRQSEFMRERRFGFWRIIGCVFAAWLLHLVTWYPQPTGMAVAAIVASATQLASPWLPPSKREALARQEVA
ncbi:MAG: serine/threonine-protein kinase, partial [Planctomycetota bacterium]